ncbi:aldehyde dehydrogenase (NAD+) [Pantoea sp. PA1]|uniref:aldehyde dehydrogenase family protein n=1 Tax=Pantoea ananas TaxID=553 RepID=UPI001575C99D|nr:aldehyde dehydrogenase family protein [Pantoea ananatis]MDH0053661.1 aldehyde dehydrogenase family protein [Pantoea ananatis]NQE76540.1 aldehyde dehydrogenase [Pantoea ananatis]NQE81175.1 aldehyde dehydrogenase [Pantoea ananatis]
MSDFDPDKVRLSTGHFINGQFVSASGKTMGIKRPSDGQHYADINEAGAETVGEAVSLAEDARIRSGWSSYSPRERGAAISRWADLIDADKDYLAQLEAVGSTRPITDTINIEVPFTAAALRFYAECADKYSGDVFPTQNSSLGMLVPEPYGVIGAITPWNFPLSMASWKCGPALAAGNAVVLKPSELTPFSTARLAELAVQAGIPPGVLNVVQGGGQVTGNALVTHPLVRKVSFTGSTATGAAIMSQAALHGTKPVTLELGGKSPQLVFDDAGDADEIAERLFLGFTVNAGQACVSGTRLIIQKGIAERVIEKLIALCKTPLPGMTWQAATRYCPLIDQRQGEKVATIIAQSVAQGASILAGGQRYENTAQGWFWQPTLLANVNPDNVAIQEEIFGPVLTIQTFSDEEEALALAQHRVFGLCAGVHTLNMPRAMRLMKALDSGTVWINRYRRTWDFIIPTGGFQGSGFGKDLGRQAFESCQRYKSVLIDF